MVRSRRNADIGRSYGQPKPPDGIGVDRDPSQAQARAAGVPGPLDPARMTPAALVDLQRAVGNREVVWLLQRRVPVPQEGSGPAQASGQLIVDDAVTTPGPGQMGRTMFLAELRRALTTVGEQEYRGTRFTARRCPVVEYWFEQYGDRGSLLVERAVREYVNTPGPVSSAQELIRMVCTRARRGFRSQAETGTATEIPDGVPARLGVASPEAEPSPAQTTPISAQAMVVQRGKSKKGKGKKSKVHGGTGGQVGEGFVRLSKVDTPMSSFKELMPGQFAHPIMVTTCSMVYVRSSAGRVVVYHWPFTLVQDDEKKQMQEAVESIEATHDIAVINVFTKSDAGLGRLTTYLEERYGRKPEVFIRDISHNLWVAYDGTLYLDG